MYLKIPCHFGRTCKMAGLLLKIQMLSYIPEKNVYCHFFNTLKSWSYIILNVLHNCLEEDLKFFFSKLKLFYWWNLFIHKVLWIFCCFYFICIFYDNSPWPLKNGMDPVAFEVHCRNYSILCPIYILHLFQLYRHVFAPKGRCQEQCHLPNDISFQLFSCNLTCTEYGLLYQNCALLLWYLRQIP